MERKGMAIDREAWERAGRMLASWRRPLLLSHVRPDGDAVGAMAAVSCLCRGFGARPLAVSYEDPPARYREITGRELFAAWRGDEIAAQADGILIVDTCSWQQLEPVAGFLRRSPLRRIVVDHHKTRDALADDAAVPAPVAEYLVDASASAASLLVYEWARTMGWKLGAEAAEALFVGIATDTGWFRFSNTDTRTLTAAAGLLAEGVRPDRWYAALYESTSPARTRLEGAMLSSVCVGEEGRLVWSVLTREMFAAAGASPADTEDLIQDLQRIAGVVVSVLFVEEPGGRIRASLRSKAPHVCGADVDVAAIAGLFGGGGHARAAGARLDGPVAAAQERVLHAVRCALQAGHGAARRDP